MIKLLTNQLFIGLIAGLALGYFLFHNCNSKPCPDVEIKNTSDTVIKYLPVDSNGWHVPTMAIDFVSPNGIIFSHVNSDLKSQPKKEDSVAPSASSGYLNFQDDVSSIITDYNKERYYSDTNHLKEADVIVQSKVNENKLQIQRVLLQNLKQTVITNTETMAVPERKFRLYWNLTAIGDDKVNINAAGGGLTAQFKDTRALQVNYLHQFRQLYPGQSPHQFQLTLINPFSKH